MPKRAFGKICVLIFLFIFLFAFALPASAITEEEVQKQVDAQGREAVTGNVFIWFLCAVGFLKVSQRMDSLLSSLGISVGHTGGNMLGEAMIAARTIGAATGRHFHGAGGGSGLRPGVPGIRTAGGASLPAGRDGEAEGKPSVDGVYQFVRITELQKLVYCDRLAVRAGLSW